jgi:hypothetical protein
MFDLFDTFFDTDFIESMIKSPAHYTKSEAVRAIKRLSSTGKKRTLHGFAESYIGDFEGAFREAVGEMGILAHAGRIETHTVHGRDYMGKYTNDYQRNEWDFLVYSLVLYMMDRKLTIPVLLLDNVLVDQINEAARDFGYSDIYKTYNPLRFCINPSVVKDYNKLNLSDEEKELVKKAMQDREEYIKADERISAEELEKERAEAPESELPHWMQVVHEANMAEDEEESEED